MNDQNSHLRPTVQPTQCFRDRWLLMVSATPDQGTIQTASENVDAVTAEPAAGPIAAGPLGVLHAARQRLRGASSHV
jgi:hypothetical protein